MTPAGVNHRGPRPASIQSTTCRCERVYTTKADLRMLGAAYGARHAPGRAECCATSRRSTRPVEGEVDRLAERLVRNGNLTAQAEKDQRRGAGTHNFCRGPSHLLSRDTRSPGFALAQVLVRLHVKPHREELTATQPRSEIGERKEHAPDAPIARYRAQDKQERSVPTSGTGLRSQGDLISARAWTTNQGRNRRNRLMPSTEPAF
jgi:hypothetical protein